MLWKFCWRLRNNWSEFHSTCGAVVAQEPAYVRFYLEFTGTHFRNSFARHRKSTWRVFGEYLYSCDFFCSFFALNDIRHYFFDIDILHQKFDIFLYSAIATRHSWNFQVVFFLQFLAPLGIIFQRESYLMGTYWIFLRAMANDKDLSEISCEI